MVREKLRKKTPQNWGEGGPTPTKTALFGSQGRCLRDASPSSSLNRLAPCENVMVAETL